MVSFGQDEWEKIMSKNNLEFEAVKYSCREDEDGELKLILRVSMQDKLSAIALPVKKRLKIKVDILND